VRTPRGLQEHDANLVGVDAAAISGKALAHGIFAVRASRAR
jgi:hypothetical protein